MRTSILTEVFCGFSLSFQGNARPQLLPCTSFPIHYSLIMPFDLVSSELLV
jgi:hypothetical protein